MVHRRGCRRSAAGPFACTAALAGILLAVVTASSASAQLGDVFTVRGVAVDVTAEAAAAAREAALVDGQRIAFGRLLRRLTLRQDHSLLPALADDEIVEYVRGFEVEKEKASTVRYLAELTVRFKSRAIRRLLRSAGIPFAETVSKPVVVLPVFQAAGTSMLWDEPNPWRQAWLELPTGDALVPLVVPAGDLADMADISADQATRAERDRLDAISRRYGAADALVTVASLTMDLTANRHVLDVAVSRFGPVIREHMVVLSFSGTLGETVEDMLRRAAVEVAGRVEEDWKRDNLLRFDREETLSVTVSLNGLADWLEIRKRLRGVPFIRDAELMSLSRSTAVVRLRFIGDIDQMTLAFAQSDLDLFEGATSWVLRLQDGSARNAAR
jgi:hypothetical protein